MISRDIYLEPEWLPLGSDGIHSFQATIRDVSSQVEDALIVHAPTGAGKTHALRLWAEKKRGPLTPGMLVVSPTNALAQEIYENLKEQLGTDIGVYRWTSREITQRAQSNMKKIRHHQLHGEAIRSKIIVSNPDILHRFTQHAYAFSPKQGCLGNWRRAMDAFEGTELLVVDEYHAYDEQLLASILFFIMKAKSNLSPMKAVFLSATPNDGLQKLLSNLKITYNLIDSIGEIIVAKELPSIPCRLIKHRINLHVTNTPILEAIPDKIPENRTLFIFKRFADVFRASQNMPSGMPKKDVKGGYVPITGRNTQSDSGQMSWNNAQILLGTSKVDVGLNIKNVGVFHIEPGWEVAQAWQRLGRAGRDGEAEVTIHLDVNDIILNGFTLNSKETLNNLFLAIYKEKYQNILKTQRWMARYLAAYHISTPNQKGHRDISIDLICNQCPQAKEDYYLTLKIFRTQFSELTGVEGEFTEKWWQNQILESLKSLRGQTIRAWTHYTGIHNEGEAASDDLIFILRNTEHSTEIWSDGLKGTRKVFVVHRLLEEPKDVDIHLPLFADDQFRISIKSNQILEDEHKTWVRKLREYPGIPDPKNEQFRNNLANWLDDCGPGVISSTEAEVDDFII